MTDTTQVDNAYKVSVQTAGANSSSQAETAAIRETGVVINYRLNPAPLPMKTVRGQRHIAPPGRHSKQTHPRAQARAEAQGHTTEKELHAYDRSIIVAANDKRTANQLKQQKNAQNVRAADPKESETGKKQEN